MPELSIIILKRIIFWAIGFWQQGRPAEAEVEFERLWGSSHVKQAMADLVRNEQNQDNGTSSWRALVDPRYIRGTHPTVATAF